MGGLRLGKRGSAGEVEMETNTRKGRGEGEEGGDRGGITPQLN